MLKIILFNYSLLLPPYPDEVNAEIVAKSISYDYNSVQQQITSINMEGMN